jgi:hypothetical protein
MFDDKYIKDSIDSIRYFMDLYWTSSGCYRHGKETTRCLGHNAAYKEEAESRAKKLIKEYPQTKNVLSDILGGFNILLEDKQ